MKDSDPLLKIGHYAAKTSRNAQKQEMLHGRVSNGENVKLNLSMLSSTREKERRRCSLAARSQGITSLDQRVSRPCGLPQEINAWPLGRAHFGCGNVRLKWVELLALGNSCRCEGSTALQNLYVHKQTTEWQGTMSIPDKDMLPIS